MLEEIQPDPQTLSDAEREELEALRKASHRGVMVNDFKVSEQALSLIFATSIDQYATLIGAWMRAQGFWDSNNFGEKIALVHTELSEALEAHRGDLTSDHLPGVSGVGEELADAVIRILDLAAGLNLPLGQIIHTKMQYNFNRPYKHGKAY